MRFVHSLVRTQRDEERDWRAPVEIGEDAPHYASFVIPVVNSLDDRYACEIIRVNQGDRQIIAHELVREGKDSFSLEVEGARVWFVVRPVANEDRRLPYVGKLKHPDFGHLFTEIEPEDPATLDQLFLEKGVGILGCDPFVHYSGAKKFTVKRT